MALARAYAVGLYTEDGQPVRIHSFALFCISHFFLAACICSHPDTRALSLVAFLHTVLMQAMEGKYQS